ncbi:MAG TPA: hypothetical protein VE993_10410 [Stellaceae bacterium]|nr:hypothetical protein [Stellaceae bacterium]
MITIAIINEATVVADADMPAVVAALQKQVEEHFWPAWGLDAELDLVAKGTAAPPGAWQLVILDDSDQADALGYHETTEAGLPLAKVFARTTIEDGGSWTVAASHELLEMLADPEINLSVFVQDDETTGKLYAYEVCDPVEEATYLIDGIQVSDFVLPSYFERGTVGATPAAPFDFLKRLVRPLPALLPGGYLSVFQVEEGGGWTQIADMRKRHARMVPPDGSRRHRRMLPKSGWRRSAVISGRTVAPAARGMLPDAAASR